MWIITISRSYGSAGTRFAHELSMCTGYTYVDEEYAAKLVCDSHQDGFFFAPEDEEKPSFLKRLTQLIDNRSFYKTALSACLYDLALKNDLIIVGRGAYIIFSEFPNAINLQIVRHFTDRVKAIAKLKNISYDDTLELITKKDKEKKGFIHYYFDKDLSDPTVFHLVLNSSHVSLESGLEMVCTYSRQYFAALQPAEIEKFLKNRLLEKKAEMMLFHLEMTHSGKMEFEVQEEGILIAKGVVGGKHAKENLIKGLQKIPDVKEVIDQVKVDILSRSLY